MRGPASILDYLWGNRGYRLSLKWLFAAWVLLFAGEWAAAAGDVVRPTGWVKLALLAPALAAAGSFALSGYFWLLGWNHRGERAG